MQIQAGADLFILDCGTGIRELGHHLLASGTPISGTILLSHSHWDHIQGFPFFVPLLIPGHSFAILGPQSQTERLNDTLAGQMQYRYFPIGLDQLAADIRYQETREERFRIGSTMVGTHYLNHTSMALAYRLEARGRSVVYATDTEPFSQQPRAWAPSGDRAFLHRRDEDLAEFIRGSDVLIIDAQYTSHEYPARIGWGHGTPDYALDLAISAGVGTLVLFHHDPTRIDTALTVVEQLAQQRVAREAPDLEVLAAAEGLSLDLEDEPSGEVPAPARNLPEFHPRVRIGVVGARDEFVILAQKALAQDHYDLLAVTSLGAPEDQALLDFEPHLVLLECGAEAWSDQARAFMRGELGRRLPIIGVIPAGRFECAQEAFEHGASDVMIQPFAASQLRSRVDSWLMRAGVAVDRRVRRRQVGQPGTPAFV